MLQGMSMKKTQSLANWRDSLQRRHGLVERKIAAEMDRPLPDFLAIQELKRKRLLLKDELTLIEGVIRTVGEPKGPDAA